ncbi:MAG: hypothetical protein EB060_12355 [Proteobacteria bacterium]|nr:hypothetical protein [Pseudomonadota bacterium]
METVDFSRFFLSLAFVIALIWGIAWILKKFGLDKRLRGATGQAGRLQVIDVLYLDPKRKLLLARADANEYLLMISGDAVTLVDKLGEKKTDA